jgi:hypothetical protein
LSSAEGKEHLPDDNSLRSEFNFHNLDMGASLLKLRHLGLWDLKARSPTKATGPPKPREYTIAYSTSQLWHPTLVFGCWKLNNSVSKLYFRQMIWRVYLIEIRYFKTWYMLANNLSYTYCCDIEISQKFPDCQNLW